MTGLATLLWAGLCGWLDLRERRIPNALTLGGAGVGALWLLARGESLLHQAPPGQALLAMGVALLLTLPGYALRRLGAADVKLLAAMGLIGGFPGMLSAFVLGALAGAAVFLGWRLLWRIQFTPALAGRIARLGGPIPDPEGIRIPYAPGIAVGFGLSLPLAHWLAS